MTLSKDLALVRLKEIGESCVTLSTDMIEHVPLDDDFMHLLNRWLSLTSRILEVANNQHKIEFNPDIAIKFMLLEIKKQLEAADLTNSKSETLPGPNMAALKDQVDFCLEKLEHVKT